MRVPAIALMLAVVVAGCSPRTPMTPLSPDGETEAWVERLPDELVTGDDTSLERSWDETFEICAQADEALQARLRADRQRRNRWQIGLGLVGLGFSTGAAITSLTEAEGSNTPAILSILAGAAAVPAFVVSAQEEESAVLTQQYVGLREAYAAVLQATSSAVTAAGDWVSRCEAIALAGASKAEVDSLGCDVVRNTDADSVTTEALEEVAEAFSRFVHATNEVEVALLSLGRACRRAQS